MLMLDNVKVEVQGNELILRIDLTKNLGPTSSGRGILVASSHGIHPLVELEGVGVSLNVMGRKNSVVGGMGR